MSEILLPKLNRRQLLFPIAYSVCGLGFAEAAPKGVGVVSSADGRWLAPDIARIVDRKTLVVAMLGADMPPFFQQKDGLLAGLEVEIARALGKELKVDVLFDRQAKTFNEVVDVVARGDADLGISKLSRTLARAQAIRFSAPYLKLNHALVLHRDQFARLAKDRPLGAVVRKFNGKLGVIAKSSFEDYAMRNFPLAQIERYGDWTSLVNALRKGEVTAAYRDEFEAKQLLQSDPTASLILRTVTLTDLEDTLGVAVGYQSTTLLAFVDQFLSQRSDKLTIDRVLRAAAANSQ
jgi:polar amino acid transport system substrate-binding protein